MTPAGSDHGGGHLIGPPTINPKIVCMPHPVGCDCEDIIPDSSSQSRKNPAIELPLPQGQGIPMVLYIS